MRVCEVVRSINGQVVGYFEIDLTDQETLIYVISNNIEYIVVEDGNSEIYVDDYFLGL